MESSYINKQPLHVAEPHSSVFATISHSSFQAMKGEEIMSILRHKHIVVFGVPGDTYQFDKHGFCGLRLVYGQASIQGTSVQSFCMFVPVSDF